MTLHLDLNEPQIIEKVQNPRFGLLVNQNWKRLLDPYTPQDTGALMGITGATVDLSVPFQIHYKATQDGTGKPYAEYVYMSSGWAFKKPSATDHWDEKAAQAGQLDKLYRILNAGLRSGRI